MITYFIKSGLCLALLLAFYHLVLEREKMHTFNRFFLLGSMLFSFLAPLYVIYEYAPVVTETFAPTMITDSGLVTAEIDEEEPFNYTPYLIGLYVFISSLLFIRFCKNLFLIILKIRKNRRLQLENATIVLVEDAISPHTFWNYIFINKDEYFSEKVENELFTHELTHVTQKHTLDILLIEFLQVLFWINPTFILLKKAVKLNHEFLADNKVISTYKNTTEYQYLLLNRATWDNEYYLASNLNYLLTKKRLEMMTKQSSRTLILLKKLAVIPLLVGFIFLFAERVVAQEKADPKIVAEYNKLAKKYNNQSKGKQVVKLKEVQRMEELYSKLNDAQKLNAEKYPNIPPPPPPIAENAQVVKEDFVPPQPPKPIKVKKGVKYDGDIPPPPPPKKIGFNANGSSKQSISDTDDKIEIVEEVTETVGLQSENIEQNAIEEIQETKPEKGWIIINNSTHFYIKYPNGKIEYYNRWGNQVDKNGKKLNQITEQKKNGVKTGWLYVNNKTIYYVETSEKTTYYDRFGYIVDKNGKRIQPETRAKSNEVLPNQNITKVYKNDKITTEFEQVKDTIDYYIDGKKATKEEVELLLPSNIKKISVIKKTTPPRIEISTKKAKLDSIPSKTGLEQVGNKVYAYKVTNDKKQYFDEKSGKPVSVKHPEPEDYDEMMKRIKKTKKICYIENKRVSEKEFKNTVKNDKAYNLSMISKKDDKNTVVIIASKKDVDKEELLKKYR